ncbi:site-specific integrase [Mesorhizobium sp.]|uniref:tyrosine-type recombinase/integrase n=1 Tax=Mesorhizobium sp. TaxID=1871066 RepID=UPI0025C5DB72|nr:site-specific integrase [Mesorhizobium sp.]
MLAVRNKLTDTFLKTRTEPGVYGDGEGLWLRVHAGGTKSWLFIYKRAGRRREIGMGAYGAGIAQVTLAQARAKADEFRKMLAEDLDPYTENQKRKASRFNTFGMVADDFLNSKSSEWTPKTADDWRLHLTSHAAGLRNIAIGNVDTELVERTLLKFWDSAPATGQRLRGRIEAVLDYATSKRLRSGDNPSRWAGHLEHILPAASRVTGANHAAMPYADVPAFMKRLAMDTSAAARALRLTILTAVRTDEARSAKWSEIDLDAALWTIPAARTKTGKIHSVPLAEQVVALLRAVPRRDECPFVFEGTKRGRPTGGTIGNAALRVLLADMEQGGATVHGFRSAFKDWATEETDHPGAIAEMCLGHLVGTAVERAYRRGEALKKRKALMDDWAAYCANGTK